jgi:hypothetical protein
MQFAFSSILLGRVGFTGTQSFTVGFCSTAAQPFPDPHLKNPNAVQYLRIVAETKTKPNLGGKRCA